MKAEVEMGFPSQVLIQILVHEISFNAEARENGDFSPSRRNGDFSPSSPRDILQCRKPEKMLMVHEIWAVVAELYKDVCQLRKVILH